MPAQPRKTTARAKPTPAPKAIPGEAPEPVVEAPSLPKPEPAAAVTSTSKRPALVDLDDPQIGQTLRGVLPACGYTSVGIGDRSFRVDPETDILVEETT